MPQIANQDYNVIDFNELPYYEAVERLYRAYLQGTVIDCVIKEGKKANKIVQYEAAESGDNAGLLFNASINEKTYYIKLPLTTDESGYLLFKKTPVYIVSADGFKLKPVVTDGVLTGVEVTTEKVENNVPAQYFKDWIIGRPVEGE